MDNQSRFMLGIDVGGTFTDFVAYDRENRTIDVWKVRSVPTDPVVGILNGLSEFEHRDEIDYIRLGTTVGTNAVLERKGATVAYVTTKGFRDIPFIQRGNRRYHYDMSWVKPTPLVKRSHSFELTERLDAKGNVLIPLDEGEVRALAATIRATPDIQAVAVCTLFSYVNPVHELRIKAILAEELPGLPITASYEILPKWKEYERASTAIADAYLKPVVTRQLASMRKRLDQAKMDANVVVIKSNGGEMMLEAAANAPVNLVLSGPTGGVIASRSVAKLTGIDNLVTIDIGGTSSDVATVLNGRERFTTAFEIEWGMPIQIPMIDIRTIGAGGGSIAWIDNGGMLRVGPQSAGANPGPACYSGGGTLPTVTDANVVLGRIDPNNFLGGRMKLDAEAARLAVSSVADQLGRSIEDTALAVLKIANNNMVGALRTVLIEQGLDPRDFTLAGFGGAGPLHTNDLAADMGIPRALVPNHPGQFSASGFILTDARVDRQRTTHITSRHYDPTLGQSILSQLIAEATAELHEQGYTTDIEGHYLLEMRYLGQNYELEMRIDETAFEAADGTALWEAFHRAHKARFGFSSPGDIIEIVSCAVTLVATTPKPDILRLERTAGATKPKSARSVYFADGSHQAPVYDRGDLLFGDVIPGPAIIEEPASVTVLNPGSTLSVDEFGNLIIDILA
ncbi:MULTISPECIES: hydantoinase/oxoprolinase family protein [Agrobacterium]|uniref:hydantoinase/oxoprolinase family protein n=1 Tax=Agrobacterium TaxID=357 RepID=UPI00037978B7|nr:MULTISPECIES: hydantoinase/oxoprolinase family protein [Agrobacterium]EPR21304.1 hypothetical protein L902_02315 [Agrobacterium radiobacter DSM 30147]KDR86846.1 hydantoin utilization protein [Agrobacterium tumefaciens GW4]KVK49987.1 hypothetical protein L903_19120 [Agrobacterium sp. JL28]KVK50277.1 hypothetical protein L904_19110 [Agrobacterium sp. LY4]